MLKIAILQLDGSGALDHVEGGHNRAAVTKNSQLKGKNTPLFTNVATHHNIYIPGEIAQKF